jgi:ABC-2 type transport system ATP-binding protein
MTWGVENASVVFGARTALDNVTLRADPATVSIVVGGDGAGKSTLLRALVGLVRLNSGVSRRPAKKEIGYVPATAGLYVDLTVDENVAFSAAAYGLRGPELAKRSAALLERIGLSGARGRLGGHLSGGMQRKLAVGMALLHRPTMLVLDEPTTGVDPVSRAELWRLIAGAAAGGSAVVVATTYVDEAHRASRVVLLEQGRSIATGAPSDIVAAVPGALGVVASGEQPSGLSWRWGSTWRVWAPTRDLPPGAKSLQPDFEDAVMIAALADEQRLSTDDAAR